MDSEPVTALLRQAGQGDTSAAERLYAVVYDDLRSRAGELMSGHPSSFTLQPTAVVHEAWIRLCGPADAAAPHWNERDHFMAVASKAMRSVLVDHARRRSTDKRGGERRRVVWDEALAEFEERAIDLMGLDEALTRLAEVDAELASLVELRFFGGLSIAEAARALDKSTATVERGWRTARAWLRAELIDEQPTDAGGDGG